MGALTLTWRVQVSDGVSLSSAQDLTVTITGTNDAPEIRVAGTDRAEAPLTETDDCASKLSVTPALR